MDVYSMFVEIEAEIVSERGSGTLIDGQFEKSNAGNGIKKEILCSAVGNSGRQRA